MTAKPDTTLHAAFSSLKERGFTPKIQYLEVFERYSSSTRNTHLRHYLTLFWEHENTVYDADVLEQFFDGERRGAVRAAIMRGDFELELVREVPEGTDLDAFRETLKRETIAPAVSEWTTRMLGYPVSEAAASSCYEVMNADGEFVCWCPESHSRVIR
ncbi:hypothetical protein [Rothia aeria]|jgi:hypothetical protein|uniref:hypothetical protein n=1 Tax=Rothia aeria TaxID=172042 RepID=UPI00242BA95F|nr:hypothetical protein [Rothia aeria]